jgi:L-asparaginase II
MPFLEHGGQAYFDLSLREIALMCASHIGSDDHVAVARSIQAKTGVSESELLCGVHPLSHQPTIDAMRLRNEPLSSNRHNCSGKHTGMLAHARMRGLPISDYINLEHQIQQTILQALAEMCGVPQDKVEVGIDGCSVPNFAVPLYNCALGFARLCDPRGLSPERAAACRRITQSMMANPGMVGGPGRFDTRLMETSEGRLIAKAGAEGYMAIGVMSGTLGAGSPGIGIALKIADGDPESRSRSDANSRARPAVTLEVLHQLGILTDKEMGALKTEFGPVKPVTNWRKLLVGEIRPAFTLQRPASPDE